MARRGNCRVSERTSAKPHFTNTTMPKFTNIMTASVIAIIALPLIPRMLNTIVRYLNSRRVEERIEDDTECVDILDADTDDIISAEDRACENALDNLRGPKSGVPRWKWTRFRKEMLMRLRAHYHFESYPDTVNSRRVLRRKLESLMYKYRPDIRLEDVYLNADIIVEYYFIPSAMDLEVRAIRGSLSRKKRIKEYYSPVRSGGWLEWWMGDLYTEFAQPSRP